MPINGDFAIFRCTNAGDTETTLTDKIEFEGDAAIPDANSKVVATDIIMSRTETQNSSPFQEMARKPDTGFSGNRYTIRAFFDESAETAAAIARLIQWYTESNSTIQIFKNGRFGIRNNYRPEFNLTPNNDAGYKLVHLEITQEQRTPRLILATIILEFSGTPSRLRANTP